MKSRSLRTPSSFSPNSGRSAPRAHFSRAVGPDSSLIEQGAAVYVLPPEILARFAGQEKMYFALATFSNGKGSAEIVKVPTPGSPYINLQGLSGRSLRRVRVVPSRQRMMSSYHTSGGSEMEWAGDAAAPGSQPLPPTPAILLKPIDPAAAAHTAAFNYNDGFGPIPENSRNQAEGQVASEAEGARGGGGRWCRTRY